MPERERNPKLEIETNIPVVVTIGKMFYKGKNNYGEYFGYNLTYNGSEYTFFASPFVHERFQSFGQGATLNVVKRQKAGDRNATWEISEVNGTQKGAARALQTSYDHPKPIDRMAYRGQRIDRMHEAWVDATQVRDLIGQELTSEDLRAIAISFVIDELRQGVPLEDVPAKFEPDFNIPAILEEIKAELTKYVPGTSETDQSKKADLLEKGFDTRVWQNVTQMKGEWLVQGLAKLRAAIVEDQEDIPF